MTEPRAAFKSALWNHAGRILEYVCIYLTSVLIARSLGVLGNGVYAGLISFSQLLLVLSSFGLEASLNKHIPQLDHAKQFQQTRFVLRRVLIIRAIVFVLVATLLAVACEILPFDFLKYARVYIWFLVLYTGLRSLVAVFSMVLVAQFRTDLTAKINLAVRIIECTAVAILIQFGVSIENLFVLFVATGILHVACYAYFSRVNWAGPEETAEFRPIVIFGGIFWANTIVDFFLGRHGDILLLTNMLSDSSEASLYDVAFSVAQLASLAFTVGLAGVTFATFATLAASAPATMDRFYGFALRMTNFLTIPVYGFLLFNAGPVMAALYSSKYAPAAALLQGMMGFRIVARLFGGPENAEYLLSKGLVTTIVGVGVMGAVTNLVLNLLLIPGMGATGSVIASGSGNLIANLLGGLVVYRLSANRMQFLSWLKLTAVCCSASLLCRLLSPSPGVPFLILLGLVYLSAVLFILMMAKPLTERDYDWLAQIDVRLASLARHFTRTDRKMVSAEGRSA